MSRDCQSILGLHTVGVGHNMAPLDKVGFKGNNDMNNEFSDYETYSR